MVEKVYTVERTGRKNCGALQPPSDNANVGAVNPVDAYNLAFPDKSRALNKQHSQDKCHVTTHFLHVSHEYSRPEKAYAVGVTGLVADPNFKRVRVE